MRSLEKVVFIFGVIAIWSFIFTYPAAFFDLGIERELLNLALVTGSLAVLFIATDYAHRQASRLRAKPRG